jgi:hypothetical protein
VSTRKSDHAGHTTSLGDLLWLEQDKPVLSSLACASQFDPAIDKEKKIIRFKVEHVGVVPDSSNVCMAKEPMRKAID